LFLYFFGRCASAGLSAVRGTLLQSLTHILRALRTEPLPNIYRFLPDSRLRANPKLLPRFRARPTANFTTISPSPLRLSHNSSYLY